MKRINVPLRVFFLRQSQAYIFMFEITENTYYLSLIQLADASVKLIIPALELKQLLVSPALDY